MCDHRGRRQAAENTELTHKACAEVGAGERWAAVLTRAANRRSAVRTGQAAC